MAVLKPRDAERALQVVLGMTIVEQHAFVALFARTCANEWMVTKDGRIIAGKNECEIDGWREFYSKRLVAAGLVTYVEKSVKGVRLVYVRPTALGAAVRDAWWNTEA